MCIFLKVGLIDALKEKQPMAATLTSLSKLKVNDDGLSLILNKQSNGLGGKLEGARFVTVGGVNANRQFQIGITTPVNPAGNSYGQLFYATIGSNVTAGWEFDENGHARCVSPGGTWDNASDIRIKDNVESINNALSIMLSLKGCTWRFKENSAFGMGLIAQDVEAIFPEVVNKSSYTTAEGEVIPDLLSLNAGNVIAALAPGAFRDMSDMIEGLKSDVAALKEQVAALQSS